MFKVKENRKILPKPNVLQENLDTKLENIFNQSKIKEREKWKRKNEKRKLKRKLDFEYREKLLLIDKKWR